MSALVTSWPLLGDDELWVGEMRPIQVAGRHLLLVRTEGGVHAYDDRCPHLGVRLSTGLFDGATITCPAHHFQYDAATGCGINPRNLCLKGHGVRCEAGQLWVDLAPEQNATEGE